MMTKKLLLVLVSFICIVTITSTAQDHEAEVLSGYKGGFLPSLKTYPGTISFLVAGDWGRNGEYHQKEVAEQMAKASATLDADFILSVGDNFYPNGVRSTQDPQWISSYEDIYTQHFLNRDWLVALGNHDYQGSIQAQIDYSKISRRWIMPSPYYSKKINIRGGKQILLVVMDTNPFIESYYKKEGDFATNLQQQDTATQRKWLVETLSDTSSAIAWRIVVGHHPLYSGGKRKEHTDTKSFANKFATLFDAYKVDAYLCGHEHDLQIIKQKGAYTTQFLSGAASEVRPSGNTIGTLFAVSQPGFMTFSVDAKTLHVQVVKSDGSLLYSTSIPKQ